MSSRFYQTHAQDYFNQTIEVDPSSFLLPLVEHLTPGSKVLDIGCGSGRDMLWLSERGFHCKGLERSPDLAALARDHTGLPVIEADFESYDLSRMNMDAVLLIGALVHLPYERFSPVLTNILKALKPGGHALITMKQGQGRQEADDGRIFYLWDREDLSRVFKVNGLICVDSSVQTSQVRETDIWLSFVLQT
ncbi:class I SAM-dependent methyltransferase [Desulfonatronovibrio hydrogenovorans]|uniref:class I SAM-dependent methyltransferase n=1 Tax=Desulfonatronovibrio hydrogenovorans TaxID=53245 RepID=UPI00048F2FA8|nr:class I SAM-dependent methyltransferase [Desulfonatronovibrio hydrogenovorans]